MPTHALRSPHPLDAQLQRDVLQRLTRLGVRVTGVALDAVYIRAAGRELEAACAALSAWTCLALDPLV